jgi:leucyl aminopeptidase
MNAFLGVAQGSVEPPFMLILKYLPQKGKKAKALVGKGVTFDSGGISIKPSAKMNEMKADMSGAAAVLASMVAISHLKPAQNIVAVMALTENMPSGSAQRPGDVISAMNGKTIEIINTDAEGRLVLADALCYALTLNVSEMVDIATLTGACSVALGDVASAILGNDQALIDRFLSISQQTGEKLWQLPLYDEYNDYMKSEVADLANASENRLGGTCYGAKFLEAFVDKTPWVHLDIASMMHYAKASGYQVKGMSGVGVLNLVAYCCQ